MDVIHRNHVRILDPQAHDAPVLLYAHGFGCSQDMWRWITPAFAPGHRQVVFDYVGSGRSDAFAFDPVRYATLQGYCDDLLEVCDALGLRSGVHLVAHSVSCSIGLLAAARRPGLFADMVLIGPSPCFVNHPPDYHGGFEASDLEGLLELMDQNYIGWARHLGGVVAGPSHDGVAGELAQSFCSTEPRLARAFARATFFADNRADLAAVGTPSLILQHARDALAPRGVGEYLQRHLRGSRLQVLDVAGHCAHMSHPELVIDAMREYYRAC